MKSFIKLINLGILIVILAGCSDGGESLGPTSSDTGIGGSLARFAVSKNYLYAVDYNYLKLFNLNNPEQPNYEKKVYLNFDIETIFPRDSNTLFIGSETGMYIYDISIASNPVKLSIFSHVWACDPVVADDEYAYITLHSEDSWCGRTTNELQIVDITDLTYPKFKKSYQMTSPRGLGIDSQENLLFVCDEGLKVYDANDIYNLILKHHFDINAIDVIPYKGNLMVIGDDGLYQYSYANDTIVFLSKIGIE